MNAKDINNSNNINNSHSITNSDFDICCLNHPNKFAKRSCEKCKQLICNSCALDYHSDHIECLTNINQLYLESSLEGKNEFIKLLASNYNSSLDYYYY